MSDEVKHTSKRQRTRPNRVIVQVLDATKGDIRIVSDLGPVDTVKAKAALKSMSKHMENLHMVYWF